MPVRLNRLGRDTTPPISRAIGESSALQLGTAQMTRRRDSHVTPVQREGKKRTLPLEQGWGGEKKGPPLQPPPLGKCKWGALAGLRPTPGPGGGRWGGGGVASPPRIDSLIIDSPLGQCPLAFRTAPPDWPAAPPRLATEIWVSPFSAERGGSLAGQAEEQERFLPSGAPKLGRGRGGEGRGGGEEAGEEEGAGAGPALGERFCLLAGAREAAAAVGAAPLV